MGHANIRTVKKALARHSIPFSDNFSLCHACSISKAHKLPFHDSNFVATQPLELICSDLWGPAPVQSVDGASYYLLFFDHYSKYCWIYFLRKKSDVLSVFIQFRSLVENYFGHAIKTFQADWGGKFQSLQNYLSTNGITQRVSCPYTPE